MIPNFLYIGTSKAGSTWIYNALAHHPDVYLPVNKGMYYFDGHFDRGEAWYLSHFQEAAGQLASGEVSHTYLFSPDACRRIAQLNPDMKLLVCLREPVNRAFSDYLDKTKNGQTEGTFEAVLEQDASLIERGRYAKYLTPYLEQFGRDNLHVGVFDELQHDPQLFSNKMFRFLGLSELELDPKLLNKRMPAGTPRLRLLTKVAKMGSELAKRLGFRRLRTKFKTSHFFRHLVYRPYTKADRPKMNAKTELKLREQYRDEIERIDSLLGTDFWTMWGYNHQRSDIREDVNVA